MKIKETDIAVIGAGSAGLSAACQAAAAGAKVLVIDENHLPGGQLFKQIHKFFGSREHQAGVRGFRIGEDLLRQVEENGVELGATTEILLQKIEEMTLYILQLEERIQQLENGKGGAR